MKNYRITTESGAVYLLKNGFCFKTDHFGFTYAPFKVWSVKSVSEDIDTWLKLLSAPANPPEVGKSMYVSGKDEWWLSTKVSKIEEIEEEDAY